MNKMAEKIQKQFEDVKLMDDVAHLINVDPPLDMGFRPYGERYKTGDIMEGTFSIKQRSVTDVETALGIAKANEKFLSEKIDTEDIETLHSEIDLLRQAVVCLAYSLQEKGTEGLTYGTK
jgi:hypothetical protein